MMFQETKNMKAVPFFGCVRSFVLEICLQFFPFCHKNGNRNCLSRYLKRRVSGKEWCWKLRRPPFFQQDVFFVRFHFYGGSFFLFLSCDIYAVFFVSFFDILVSCSYRNNTPGLANSYGIHEKDCHTSDK